MADYAYGFLQNTNYVITSNTMYEVGRNYRFSTSFFSSVTSQPNNWTTVSAGAQFWWAGIQNNGTLWTNGYNASGQLGTGDNNIRSTPVQIGNINYWTKVATGASHTLALQSNGTLWACGYNGFGQIGNNSQGINMYSLVQVGASNLWTNVFSGSGSQTSYGIQTPGTLWGWGMNSSYQLGISNNAAVITPVQIGTVSSWVQLSGSGSSAMAIQSNGTLWGWGLNQSSILGMNTTGVTYFSTPTQVGTSSNWAQVSCGYFSAMGIQSNGTLWAWGSNSYGQLGLNTISANIISPVQVGTLSIWQYVACGYGTAAVQSNGTLWTTGLNSSGQLGLGDTNTRSSFTRASGTINKWTKVSGTGSAQTAILGIQNNGTLWSVGINQNGALGYDTTSYRSSAIQIGAAGVWTGFPTGSQNNFWGAAINSNNNLYVWGQNQNRLLNYNYYVNDTSDTTGNCGIIINPVPLDPTLSTPIKSVSFGDQFGVYVQSNGTLWAWGNNSYGQTNNYTIPSLGYQAIPSATYMSNWKQIACGYYYCVGLQSNGTIWSFGANSYGQLGINTTLLAGVSSPQQIGGLNTWTQISCGYRSAAGLQSNGTLWTWGDDAYGQLAQNNTLLYSSPVQVGALSTWTRVSAGSRHMLALQSNGTLWAWGYNGFGALGTNNTTNTSSPVQVGALTSWAKISAGFFSSYAIQSNGTLWTWGNNQSGSLGLGDVTNRSSPVQVGALSTWTQVYGGYFFALAIQSNGTLWSWGQGGNGALGLGDVTNRSSPVQVGALSGWTSISASVYTSSAILNGALYMMGNGTQGQLGQGNLSNYSSPVQVGTSSNWTQAASGYFHSTGLQSTGVWSTWGQNGYGQLGNQATVSPLQIGALSNWVSVCCGLNWALAVKNDGTLWAWGNNQFGQLGTNNQSTYSSPTQVGSANNWSRVACGYTHTVALQSNGTLWAWGSNSYGQLGQGNFISTSTPIQVGTLSRYVTVYAMNYTTLAETQ